MHGIRLNKKRNLQLFGLRKSAYNFFWILKGKKKKEIIQKESQIRRNLTLSSIKGLQYIYKKIKNLPSHTTSKRKEQGSLGQQIPSFIATGSYIT